MATLYARRKVTHQFKETARQDPYRTGAKLSGTSRCPVCQAVSFRGAWRPYAEVKSKIGKARLSVEKKCPACRQLEDRYAMGVVELLGDRWKDVRDVVLQTIRNSESNARRRNDQERILWTQDQRDGSMKVYVTLPELARRIGRELEKTFKGIAEYRRSTEEPYLRVRWWSDSPHVGHEPGAPLALKRKSRISAAKPKPKSRAFRGRSAK